MKLRNWVAALLLVTLSPVAAQEAESSASPRPAQEASAETVTSLSDLAITVEDILPQTIPTEHFAARSAYRSFELSPDGQTLASMVVSEGNRRLALIDAETGEVTRVYNVGESERVDWYRWAGNEKLIMSISMLTVSYGIPIRVSRLAVRNVITNDVWLLDAPRSVLWGGDLVHVDEEGQYALVSMQRSRRSDPSVYRYALEPGAERERIVRPKGGVQAWYADDAGVVRMGIGYRNRRLRIYYRDDANGSFELIDKLRAGDDKARYWKVVRIISGSDQGYVLEENDQGRIGVRLFDYKSGQTVETFYENDNWDVEELWLDRDGLPLAALYTDDRDQIEWFDEDMARLHQQLKDALGFEDVQIVSRSRNNERMLIWGGSEADPGALYLYTPSSSRAQLLGNYRPELDFKQLARPVPIRYEARDGLEITAYLTLPRGREPSALPLIILPHGGPFGLRDKLEYNDEVQLLANRGYAVLQPNFRGSGGYGEAFYEAGRGQVGRKMQDDIDDAMDWAVAQGIADPSRVCVVGSSYGGFAALWAVIRNPERYACAASWAGVTDWDRMMSYDRRYLGRKRARELRSLEEGEDADLDEFSPINLVNTLNRPVLLAHGTRDARVPVSQYRTFVSAASEAPIAPETLLVEGEGHSFSKAENEKAWYDALIKFLAEHNPADPVPPPS